ncbi:MAG: hypothetical protein MMC33_001865 [Icmadophila ericetorum]|nr:hypothetical protein [Icmadophila ericetorum]
MSLQVVYQSFLRSPNASVLTDDASLNYITTLTTIKGAATIVKHVISQGKILEKKQENVLNTVEGGNAISLEVETIIEFVSGGGPYLPNLDDNFLADRVVTIPIIHTVHFSHGKIQQIRLFWDQGSLLKQIEVIGSRGNNWPIRDGKDQIRLISTSVGFASSGVIQTQEGDVTITSRTTSPRKRSNVDPRTTLDLFAPREERRDRNESRDPSLAPRASMKPPPRDYHDLFVGNDSDASPASRPRGGSPTKENRGQSIAPKGGAGKSFQPSRIFDTEDSLGGMSQQSPEKKVKVHPKKYEHFEFGDGSDEPPMQSQKIPTRPKTKHQSQWDFEDFTTPVKAPQRARPQEGRSFDLGEETNQGGLIHPRATQQGRRDAEKHFEFTDEGTPTLADRPISTHTRNQGSKTSASLYQNSFFDSNADAGPTPAKVTKPIANVKDRRKDFDPHFDLVDSSPGLGEKSASDNNKPIPEARTKSVKQMNASWDFNDEAEPTIGGGIRGQVLGGGEEHPFGPPHFSGNGKENYSIGGSKTMTNTKISTAGDGMGGKKGSGRTWGIGDDSDEERGAFRVGKRQTGKGESSLWEGAY